VAAALAAARCGSRVRLIESAGRIGGNVGLAQVHTLCGLYLPPEKEQPPVLAHGGYVRSLVRRLQAADIAGPPRMMGRVAVLPIDPWAVVSELESFLEEEKCLEVCCGCRINRLQREDGGYLIESEQGSWRTARIIDCTGGGFLADALKLEKLAMPSQTTSYVVGIRSDGLDECRKCLSGLVFSSAVRRAAAQGDLPQKVRSASWMVVSDRLAMITVHLPVDGPENRADLEALKQAVHSLLNWASENLPAWPADACPVWPERVGVRESGHVRGKTIVRIEDWESSAVFSDGVAVNTWPSEIWKDQEGARFHYFPVPASIPLRALVAGQDGYFGMAGRCISVDEIVAGATRVLGTAMATGQAIGMAAALSVDKGCQIQEVSPQEVSKALSDYFPDENDR